MQVPYIQNYVRGRNDDSSFESSDQRNRTARIPDQQQQSSVDLRDPPPRRRAEARPSLIDQLVNERAAEADLERQMAELQVHADGNSVLGGGVKEKSMPKEEPSSRFQQMGNQVSSMLGLGGLGGQREAQDDDQESGESHRDRRDDGDDVGSGAGAYRQASRGGGGGDDDPDDDEDEDDDERDRRRRGRGGGFPRGRGGHNRGRAPQPGLDRALHLICDRLENLSANQSHLAPTRSVMSRQKPISLPTLSRTPEGEVKIAFVKSGFGGGTLILPFCHKFNSISLSIGKLESQYNTKINFLERKNQFLSPKFQF